MENASAEPGLSFPTTGRIALAGFAGGIVLNLIDTPWSVIVMVPRMKPFFDSHGFESSPFTGPWFLSIHFLLMTAIAYLYALMRKKHGVGSLTALKSGLLMLVLNRAFGFGTVLMGIMPAEIFFGFSASMIPGTLFASVVAGWMLDRKNELAV